MKILYIGNFGENGIISGGQISKTINIYCLLKSKYIIKTININRWKKNPFDILKEIFVNAKHNDIIFAVLAKNSRLFLLPFLVFLKKIYKKKLIFYVIGGTLPQDTLKHKILRYNVKCCDYVFVETKKMISLLLKQSIDNTVYMPAFSTRKPVLNYLKKYCLDKNKKFRTFSFSRICEEKGIGDAIHAISVINNKYNINISLDIYGVVDSKYRNDFFSLIKENSEYVHYCGYYDNESLETFKNYFLYIFPTHHIGEGFPTTIIESMMAGVPIIASDWLYNSEIIENEKTGYLFDLKEKDSLINTILLAINNKQTYNEMRKNVYEHSKDFSVEKIEKIIDDCMYN